jgi:DnaD/phage-associated family protein
MAQRRMFSKKITDTDVFLDMSLSAQCLYFHLNMEADDDGFLGNTKTIMRKIGASSDDLKLLFAKQFLIPFDNGVVVVKDWKIHNYIQKDRYNETQYLSEKRQLIVEENGMYTKCIQDGYNMDTQVRLGKFRLGKDRLEEEVGALSIYSDNTLKSITTDDKKSSYCFYEQNFGQISPFLSEKISKWVDDLSEELVIKAMEITLERNKRSFSYTEGILKDWHSKNVKTLDDVQALDNEFAREKEERNATAKGGNDYDSVQAEWANRTSW